MFDTLAIGSGKTVTPTVAVWGAEPVTAQVAEYVVDCAGETLIDVLVAPVDQVTDPAQFKAVRVVVPPEQTDGWADESASVVASTAFSSVH